MFKTITKAKKISLVVLICFGVFMLIHLIEYTKKEYPGFISWDNYQNIILKYL